MIKIYDTMSRDLREFVPIEEGKVRMYVCGPTVYNYIHVGNARSTVAFDTIHFLSVSTLLASNKPPESV